MLSSSAIKTFPGWESEDSNKEKNTEVEEEEVVKPNLTDCNRKIIRLPLNAVQKIYFYTE